MTTPETGEGAPPDGIVEPGASSTGRKAILTATATRILAYLNEKSGRRYKPLNGTLAPILARLREDVTENDCRKVVDAKVAEWGEKADMAKYLRPETLFGGKFGTYLAAADEPETESREDYLWNHRPDGTPIVRTPRGTR